MAGGGTKLPRSSPHSSSSHNQAASPTSVLRPGRILTWRALTSSSWNPRSSSTYQIGFQYWPVASITTWVTPLGLQPVRQGLQAGGERRVGADLLAATPATPTDTSSIRDADGRPPPAPCRHPAPRPVPRPAPPLPPPTGSPVLVAPGRANRGNDAETRARSKQFVVPGRPPHQSRTRARTHQ